MFEDVRTEMKSAKIYLSADDLLSDLTDVFRHSSEAERRTIAYISESIRQVERRAQRAHTDLLAAHAHGDR